MQIDKVFLDTSSVLALDLGSFTPAATAAASSVAQTITVPAGTPALSTSDLVFVTGPASGNNVSIAAARVASATTISVVFINPTAGALTHAAGTFRALVVRI